MKFRRSQIFWEENHFRDKLVTLGLENRESFN